MAQVATEGYSTASTAGEAPVTKQPTSPLAPRDKLRTGLAPTDRLIRAGLPVQTDATLYVRRRCYLRTLCDRYKYVRGRLASPRNHRAALWETRTWALVWLGVVRPGAGGAALL